jgi:hypothetical protein
MKLDYNGPKYRDYSKVKIPKGYGDMDEKSYLYFIRINDSVFCKVGEACDIIRRMTEHCKSYKTDEIYILWISPLLSKYTAQRIEKRTIREWQEKEGWEYKRNDRFIIPDDVKELTIKIKKEYTFSIV